MFYVDLTQLAETIEFLYSELRKIQQLKEQMEELQKNALPEQRKRLREAAEKLEGIAHSLRDTAEALQILQEQMEQYRRTTSGKMEELQKQVRRMFATDVPRRLM